MLSISFLPWLLLLLGIVLAIPIVSFVETSRQKKALAAAEPPAEEGEIAEAEGEEVFAEDAGAGFGDDAGFPSGEAAGGEGFGDDFGDFSQQEGVDLGDFEGDRAK
ncbi:hypothetical protein [Candidatus Laterigemmans baculatus]|uniref:hypothetical protein n=1 Tax=Candidatus Laterigemmans baculatus TaxID=2770505 RepID=UPI0013DADF04|nr:hypothetical protein [Candidatus Laterigemmans baculatus]